MISSIKQQLKKAFRIEPPPVEEELSDCHYGLDEVREDISIFVGKRWDEIRPHDFYEHVEAMVWLRPESFAYYFPALIHCSMQEIEAKKKIDQMELILDTILYKLTSYQYPHEDVYSNMQFLLYTVSMAPLYENKGIASSWKKLTKEQADVIRMWLHALAESGFEMPEDYQGFCNCLANYSNT